MVKDNPGVVHSGNINKIKYLQNMKPIEKAERILIKIGTAVITRDQKLNKFWMRQKVKEISGLIHSGKKIIMISSGAVGAGMEIEQITKRPKNILKLQLLSGIGQPRLMRIYELKFKRFDVKTAQILLTHHNFSTKQEVKNLKEVIEGYFKKKILPIVNTNDILTKEELMNGSMIKFSDNDELAALVAKALKMDLMLILTNVNGLYSRYNDKLNESQLIETIEKVSKRTLEQTKKGKSPLGLGGMYSKVKAAKDVAKYKIPTVIANGKYSISDIISNKVKRTLITAG